MDAVGRICNYDSRIADEECEKTGKDRHRLKKIDKMRSTENSGYRQRDEGYGRTDKKKTRRQTRRRVPKDSGERQRDIQDEGDGLIVETDRETNKDPL